MAAYLAECAKRIGKTFINIINNILEKPEFISREKKEVENKIVELPSKDSITKNQRKSNSVLLFGTGLLILAFLGLLIIFRKKHSR